MARYRYPQAKCRPWTRIDSGLLAAGAALVSGTVAYKVVPILGAASLSVRFKGNAGALDIVFLGPDFNPDQDLNNGGTPIAFASLVGTKYTSGNPVQVAIVAATENIITATCHGENYALIKFTPSENGTVTYCDVGTVPVSF
jgi:hypothetical protein